jgi:hypothetical protein
MLSDQILLALGVERLAAQSYKPLQYGPLCNGLKAYSTLT